MGAILRGPGLDALAGRLVAVLTPVAWAAVGFAAAAWFYSGAAARVIGGLR